MRENDIHRLIEKEDEAKRRLREKLKSRLDNSQIEKEFRMNNTTLRDLRNQAGKTCAEVAEALKITPQALYRYESGVRQINLEQVMVLAEIYDASIEDVVLAQINSQRAR